MIPDMDSFSRRYIVLVLEIASAWLACNPESGTDLASETPLIEEIYSKLHDVQPESVN
jgi:hypothetical protein